MTFFTSKSRTDRQCQVPLTCKLSSKFEKSCQFLSRAKAKSRKTNCLRRELLVILSLATCQKLACLPLQDKYNLPAVLCPLRFSYIPIIIVIFAPLPPSPPPEIRENLKLSSLKQTLLNFLSGWQQFSVYCSVTCTYSCVAPCMKPVTHT
jgi:hypothetical protein